MNKGKLYGLRVYAKVLKRYVSLAVWYPMDGRTGKWQLYFSTDDSMDGREVLDYYRTRFQLEFCFRDGKQHAGITNSQSTDFRKLDFHFNASLAAVNLAKAACKRLGIAIPYPLASHSYTMLICLNDLFACLGLTQTCKLLTNFSKNSFYLLPEPLRRGYFLTNY